MAGLYKNDSMEYKSKYSNIAGSITELAIPLVILTDDFNILITRWQEYPIDFIKGINTREFRDFCKYKLYEYQQSTYYDNKLWSNYFSIFEHFNSEHFQIVGIYLLYKLRYKLYLCGLFIIKYEICTIQAIYNALVNTIRLLYKE